MFLQVMDSKILARHEDSVTVSWAAEDPTVDGRFVAKPCLARAVSDRLIGTIKVSANVGL